MKKVDVFVAILAGLGMGWLFGGILGDYGMDMSLLKWALLIIFPVLSIIGLWFTEWIGRKFLFVFQAGKFLLAGILATLVDLVVFKGLGWTTGLDTEMARVLFKGISFVVATFAKFWGNKFWAFEKMEKAGMGKELTQFYVVTLIGLAINVGVFSLIVNTIGPQFDTPLETWKTLGVIGAAIVVSVWNFLGYKFIVFKK